MQNDERPGWDLRNGTLSMQNSSSEGVAKISMRYVVRKKPRRHLGNQYLMESGPARFLPQALCADPIDSREEGTTNLIFLNKKTQNFKQNYQNEAVFH